MTQHLPPNLLALFAPRPPIIYFAPIEKSRLPTYTGISNFVDQFEDPKTVDYSKITVFRIETKSQRKERRRQERLKQEQERIGKILKTWDPYKNPKATGDAYKTLFVARINYDSSESKLKREFEDYGPIKKIRLVNDTKNSKPRGYAFIEYEKERDMRTAYKMADGRKIDGRRVLVDVERGRTVRNWRPRRLGGGLGFTRLGGEDVNQKFSGREPPAAAPGDGRPSSSERDRERPPERSSSDRKDRDRPPSDRAGAGGGGRGDDRAEVRDRDRGGSAHKDRDRDRDRDRERDRDRDRERDRDRDRERDDRERRR